MKKQIVALSMGLLAAVTVARADVSKLRGDLRDVVASAAPGELIPISIVLTHQVDEATLAQLKQITDKQDRRARVIEALKAKAAMTQQGILDQLQGAAQSGGAADITSMWLTNLVVAKATPATILAISDRPEVDWINWDRPVGEEIFPYMDSGPIGAITCGLNVIEAPRVWNELGITGRDVVVAVIDTGLCITHPDIRNQLWVNPGEIPGNGKDDEGNGFIDDINGWNFESNNNNVGDTNGHGTHTAGTVGGDGTNGQTTGVAPDCKVMVTKFFNSFSGESSVWKSMQYAVDNGGDVTTASLGWPHSVGPDRVTWRRNCENTIAAGLVVVYAAGNEGGTPPPDSVRTPGDVPSVLTIGATDCNDNIAGFSSRGPVTWQGIPPYNDCVPFPPGCLKPTVSAVGVDVLSLSNNCSGYATLSGTSMATPHVAGVVALMLEANPSLDHDQVVQILEDTSLDLGAPGPDNVFGAGRVNAFEAVSNAGGPIDPCLSFKSLNTKCKGGTLKVKIKLKDTKYNGKNVIIDVNGTQWPVPVVGKKGKWNLCCYSGSTTVKIVKPDCLAASTVDCG